MVPTADTASLKPSGHFVDFNEKNKIMFIAQPKGMYSACFGGLMAARAHHLGAAAVVVDGRFRDVREVQELGLPVRSCFLLFFWMLGFGKRDECCWVCG